MRSLFIGAALLAVASAASVAVARPADFKTNCDISVGGGCDCRVVEGNTETTNHYDSADSCKKSVELQTAENKKKLNAEIEEKFGDFKENCFPKPSGGCKCNVDEGQGEVVKVFEDAKDCRKSIERHTADLKKELNEEIKEKFGDFKENCFPKPSGGCKCNEKDSEGADVVKAYDDATLCVAHRSKRQATQTLSRPGVEVQDQNQNKPGAVARSRSPSVDGPSQNVRDPVRERAQANYQAVINELKDKFKGLKEGCFPRPKGCLCVIGKTPEGRDVTERRMDEKACRCQPGETGKECPAA